MSAPELNTQDGIALTVLAQFMTQEELPTPLNATGQAILREYFDRKGLVMVGGAVGVNQNESTSGLVSMAMKDLILPHGSEEQPVIGPNFSGDYYFPNGVGLWLPKPQ